jgi:SET domain-containing protein
MNMRAATPDQAPGDVMTVSSYRSPKTAVRRSSIVGRGLFANTAIAPGEIVCVKGGHLLTKAEFTKTQGVANDAEFQIADDLFLAPVSEAEFEDVMMFLNHSCEPNVGIQGQIVFVALRAIAAGEELTLDYATIDHDSEPMPCRCGARNCRRLITGRDWQRPELQEKYGNFFAWYLLEKIRAEQAAAANRRP